MSEAACCIKDTKARQKRLAVCLFTQGVSFRPAKIGRAGGRELDKSEENTRKGKPAVMKTTKASEKPLRAALQTANRNLINGQGVSIHAQAADQSLQFLSERARLQFPAWGVHPASLKVNEYWLSTSGF
ncbi:hypothetical protein [Longitalea arenae]|uniref:hypothetical protein n=1 Tax=Longitalea arenae TaxID=2812558 RepID=UPI0019670B42|nr:hypothetical protein [Longitalea arenae]